MWIFQERILGRVIEVGECWEWEGASDSAGRPKIRISSNGERYVERIYRLVYLAYFGVDPDSLQVQHKCDNRRCFRPEHLELGDDKKNMSDATKRGRLHRGVEHYAAKIDDPIVRAIRQARGTCKEIGQCFGVSPMTVSNIKNYKSWAHVED